jgi:hypothetical protein
MEAVTKATTGYMPLPYHIPTGWYFMESDRGLDWPKGPFISKDECECAIRDFLKAAV